MGIWSNKIVNAGDKVPQKKRNFRNFQDNMLMKPFFKILLGSDKRQKGPFFLLNRADYFLCNHITLSSHEIKRLGCQGNVCWHLKGRHNHSGLYILVTYAGIKRSCNMFLKFYLSIILAVSLCIWSYCFEAVTLCTS